MVEALAALALLMIGVVVGWVAGVWMATSVLTDEIVERIRRRERDA